MENSMEAPQKTKRTAIRSSNSTPKGKPEGI
jgi:hypothetical protein